MKALSIKQPWASLIAHGIKDMNEPQDPPFLQTAVIGWCGFLKKTNL